jgi:hypothetical protein
MDSLLSRLPYATDAAFNAYNRQHEPSCLQDTRVCLLQEINNWADSDDERFIFWLNGLAGTGKSTIARTVARKYFDQSSLGASFFFSKGGGDVGHAGKFFTTIAVELAKKSPSLLKHICDAVSENSNIANQSLGDQWRQLILGPLCKIDAPTRYIIIVDALDECGNDKDIRIILQLLAEARSVTTVRLRVLLTSRPEIPIRYGFQNIPEAKYQDFVLHNISPSTINHDISIFLEYNLQLIAKEHYLQEGWPSADIIAKLVEKASGLFIWAATAIRFIFEGFSAEERVHSLLDDCDDSDTPEEHLNMLYITVLRDSIRRYAQKDEKMVCEMLKILLGSVVIMSSTLSIASLSTLVSIPKQRADMAMKDLHAILNIPKDQARSLRLHHPSFRDFLLDQERCTDQRFCIDEQQAHQTLASHCIQRLSDFLKDDICQVVIPGTLITEVNQSQIQKCLPPEVRYACQYWIQHIQKSGLQLQDDDFIHRFLKTHLLFWLEAMSWMQKISEGIRELILLESIVDVSVDLIYCLWRTELF